MVKSLRKIVVNREQMQNVDKVCRENFGMSQAVLMERAALCVFQEIEESVNHVLILCGSGNNGGDGVALARLCLLKGMQVSLALPENTAGFSDGLKLQLSILENYLQGVYKKQYAKVFNRLFLSEVEKALQNGKAPDLIVDALFGVGLSREISGVYKEVISLANEQKVCRYAIDMPSGIDATSGKVLGIGFKADTTVTFGFMKSGCLLYPGRDYIGELKVADIGITKDAFLEDLPFAYYYAKDTCTDLLLPKRQKSAHKGIYGKVLLIAGSGQMPGACVMAGEAILRSGAGMLKVVTDKAAYPIIIAALPEAMLSDLSCLEADFEWADSIVIGPGITTDLAGVQKLTALVNLLEKEAKPTCFDADALSILAKEEKLSERLIELAKKGADFVFTPHIGELARLLHISVQELLEDRVSRVRLFCEKTKITLVSKDAATVVCGFENGKESLYFNTSGNSGMATAGSGDVLSGMLGAAMAFWYISGKKESFCGLVCKTVFLHGRAGDYCEEKIGEREMLAGDMANALMHLCNQKGINKCLYTSRKNIVESVQL